MLPFYTWSVLFLAIPWTVLDWGVAMFGMLLSFVGLIYVIPAFLQFVTMPFYFLLGIFGEIFLIPLSFFSPLLIFGALVLWVIGLMSGVDLSTSYYFSLFF